MTWALLGQHQWFKVCVLQRLSHAAVACRYELHHWHGAVYIVFAVFTELGEPRRCCVALGRDDIDVEGLGDGAPG